MTEATWLAKRLSKMKIHHLFFITAVNMNKNRKTIWKIDLHLHRGQR